MKMNLYVVYDRVAEESMPIFESRNDGTALRAYQKGIIEKNDIPEKEFMLLHVGTIEHDTSEVVPVYPGREVYVNVNMETEDEGE